VSLPAARGFIFPFRLGWTREKSVSYKYMSLPISWSLIVNVPRHLTPPLVCGSQFMARLMIHSIPGRRQNSVTLQERSHRMILWCLQCRAGWQSCCAVHLTFGRFIHSFLHSSMTLQTFLGPWPLFQFRDPIHSRQDSLDGGSARCKAVTYAEHKQRINAQRHPGLEWDSNPRSQCSSEGRQCMT
jgi:hypothetical protein